MLIDRRDNYTIDEQQDFKNLNTYDKSFEVAKIYVNNMRRIDKINEYLVERVYEEDLKESIKLYRGIYMQQEKFKVIEFIRELLKNIDKNMDNFPKKI